MSGALPVLAASTPDPTLYFLDTIAEHAQYKAVGETPGKQGETVYTVTAKVVQTFLALIGILFFGLTTYAGIRWMTARGNEEYSTKAKDTLEAAVIGFIVVMAAYALTTFILNRLNVGSPVSTAPSAASRTCATNKECDGKEELCVSGRCTKACGANGGTCGNPLNCAGGEVVNDLCPGDDSNKCCIPSTGGAI